VVVSYETIRRCHKFGTAAELSGRRPQPTGQWHLDEGHITMNGTAHWLWQAVDADRLVPDILVQERRNKEAAEAFLGRLVAGYLNE
jgi:putative transposase